jgi:8-oxo-dGTP pyrophosphatase MutT (NUDIX family)
VLKTLVDTPDLPVRLAERLQHRLPGIPAQRCFEPGLSYGRHFGPAPLSVRPAAVMVLLYRRDGAWHLPLTARPETMVHHAGQISFPGGQIEPGESSREAVLRELEEELGVAGDAVDLLGMLSPLYLYASNFTVTPWLACASGPLVFHPHAEEVSELIELPLAAVLDPEQRGTHVHRSRGVNVLVPHIAWGEHRIWGATSMILGELAAICEDLRA